MIVDHPIQAARLDEVEVAKPNANAPGPIGSAAQIADRLIQAARRAAVEVEIVCDRIDGVPVVDVESILEGRQIHFRREPMIFHYRAAAEMPRLVIDRQGAEPGL
ncbi:MAG: hypothetical protein GC191_13650 [Azospirillum sp.]|nr:hypothetical protein [Azospirillum sp.]